MTILGYIAWTPCQNDDAILYILDIIRQKHKIKRSIMKHPNYVRTTSIAVEISGLSLRLKGEKKSLKKVQDCISDMQSMLDLNLMSYTFDILNLY